VDRVTSHAGEGWQVYRDELASVHPGDTVRYVSYDYANRGKFYRKTGIVTELRGTSALGVHFPHHAQGANLIAVDDHFRLVTCVHEKAPDLKGLFLSWLQQRFGEMGWHALSQPRLDDLKAAFRAGYEARKQEDKCP
jgi:hypothetical protein